MSKSPKTKTRKKKAPAKSKAKSKAKLPETAPEMPVEAAPPPEISIMPEAAAAAEKSSGGGGKSRGGLFGLVVFLVVLVGGGYATWPYWGHLVLGQRPAVVQKPVTDDTTLQQLKTERRLMREELDRMLTRMESIENAVEAVKKMIHATARPDQQEGDADSLLALSQRLGDLEKGGQDVKSLIQRLGQLEKDSAIPTGAPDGAAQNTAKAFVLAVSNLRQAISLGAPFGDTLDALKAIAGGNLDIETGIVLLAKIAPRGTPTLAVLKDRFGVLAGRIVQASREKKEGGWVDRAVGRLSSLVTWRRVDGKNDTKGEGMSIDAIVANAENRLKAGDLKGAVKMLEGLGANSKAAKKAAPWLVDAKNRLVAERAVATLHVHAVSLLMPAKK